jgi:hypothetical protein
MKTSHFEKNKGVASQQLTIVADFEIALLNRPRGLGCRREKLG